MKDREHEHEHEHEEVRWEWSSGESNLGPAIGCRFPSARQPRPSPGLVTGSRFPEV